MKKIAIYTSFVVASLTDAAIFLTSTTYIQLAVAILLYLPLIYLALKLFPRKTRLVPATVPKDDAIAHTMSEQPESEDAGEDVGEDVEVFDINKRTFLKLIGATGISFFVSSLLSKKVGTQIFGGAGEPGITTIKDATGNIISPAEHHPIDNYKISEVDYGINTFYGFIDGGESWFIMKEDINGGTYRYIKGNTNFHDNWDNRDNLDYDYFNRIFPKT